MAESLTALYLSDPALAGRLRRQSAAEALMKQGTDASPIRAHSQGIARVAQALMGGLDLGLIDREMRADSDRQRTEEQDYLARLRGNRPAAMPAAASMPAAPAAPQDVAPMPMAQVPAPAPQMGRPAAQPAVPADMPMLSPVDAVLPAPGGAMPARAPGQPAMPPQGAGAPAPQPGGLPPRQPAIDPAEMAAIEEGLVSRNPRIVSAARARLQTLQLERQNQGNVTIREAVGPEGAGLYQFDNQGNMGRRVGGIYQAPQQPPQPGEGERRLNEYIELEKLRVAGNLSPEQGLRHQLLARQLTGQDTVAAGPNGVVVTTPSPLPTLGGAGAGGNTIPLSGNATPSAPGAPAAPMPQVPVAPAGGNVPGSDASRLPVPNQRAPVQITTPGGRAASYLPAEPSPPPGFQRSADGTELVPIPGGPQDQTRQPLSEAASRSNMFGQNMEAAHRIIGNVQAPSGATIAAWRILPEGAANLAMTANDQQYFNAVRQFAAGILRKETGAAFSAGELADVQSRFFPLPGDSAEVIRQKAEARARAIEAMRAEVPGGFRGGQSGQAGNNPRVIEYDAQGRRVTR